MIDFHDPKDIKAGVFTDGDEYDFWLTVSDNHSQDEAENLFGIALKEFDYIYDPNRDEQLEIPNSRIEWEGYELNELVDGWQHKGKLSEPETLGLGEGDSGWGLNTTVEENDL